MSEVVNTDTKTLTTHKSAASDILPKILHKFIINPVALNDEFFILGEGSFGLITLGNMESPKGLVKVAIKTSSETQHDYMILNEAIVMSQLDHVNVVKLLAIRVEPLTIVVEYMAMGDILDALKRETYTQKDLLSALQDVATGMEYISKEGYVHCDLACRNIFVNSKRQCKIGDFGLSGYVGDTNGILEKPVGDVESNSSMVLNNINNRLNIEDESTQFCNLYTAPEALESLKFTTKCDVWAMGLLMWELYFNATKEIHVLYKKFLLKMFYDTRELIRPSLFPKELYSYVLTNLLNEDPNKRPDFTEVKNKISQLLHEEGSI